MTSLEGGAGVGSGPGKDYKSPPPSAPLLRGPVEARSAPERHSSWLLPGGGSGGDSERAPGLERNGQRTPGSEDYRGKWLSLAGAAERSAGGAEPAAAAAAAEREGIGCGGRPRAARAAGEQAASRSPWSAAGTPGSCCARCSAVCCSQVRRGRGAPTPGGGRRDRAPRGSRL